MVENIDNNKYNIYIHYKTDKPLKYFDKYKLNNCQILVGVVYMVFGTKYNIEKSFKR